jgi:seryl-tRNA synthetase
MLDINLIRQKKEEIKQNCQDRQSNVDIDKLLEIDEQRRSIIQEIEGLRSERNQTSKGKPTPEDMERMKEVREVISEKEKGLAVIEDQLEDLLFQVPNMTHPDVVVSDNEEENPILETVGKPAKFDFPVKDHVELGQINDLIDLEKATEITGAKFYYLKNEAALLEFALIQFALEKLAQKGFTPVITPDLAKQDIVKKMGFNPRGESTQVYNIENSDQSLIGTAEITMGGYHMNELLKTEDLPLKYVAVSHCFRTEAGSYSKFSKGIFRVHQFTKIEMFVYTTPEKSEGILNELLECEKEIFTDLEIPFRVIDHCTADLGAPSIRTFDLEAWMPGKPHKDGSMGDWAEITSTSNCTDYQSRALNIKYKNEEGKKELVHTLNGTAIAITRAIIAILENNQQADGSIKIPQVLQKWIGKEIIGK